MNTKLTSIQHASPLGDLTLVSDGDALVAVLWPDDDPKRVPIDHDSSTDDRPPVLDAAAAQLDEYFSGTRTSFDLNLAPRGTEFQQQVWDGLLAIPYGETRSYGELAATIGRPSAARAIGAANGRNPLSIVVPCHRVIGADGSLTGFAGGVSAKQCLLDLEAPPQAR